MRRSFFPVSLPVFVVPKQMFYVNYAPSVLNFHNQPVRSAFDVEHCVRINEIGMGIDSSHVDQTIPSRGFCDFVPFVDRRFQRVVRRYRGSPRAFANYMHYLSIVRILRTLWPLYFADRELSIEVHLSQKKRII